MNDARSAIIASVGARSMCAIEARVYAVQRSLEVNEQTHLTSKLNIEYELRLMSVMQSACVLLFHNTTPLQTCSSHARKSNEFVFIAALR
jgi:uncharacterized protein YqiB (DUF1249 family)